LTLPATLKEIRIMSH